MYSLLEGFLNQEDYINVLHEIRLSNDIPWSIPITLDVGPDEIRDVKEGDELSLIHQGQHIAIITVEEIYEWDKMSYCQHVFGTMDIRHPGVEKTLKRKEFLIGGKIDLILHFHNPFERYTLWPIETRILFQERGWRYIVGFQTRNVPHIGHEYAQKAALTFTDGLFINPLVGWKRAATLKMK